ncbi:hypothetical protein KUTeg_010719 [Tegillarca granosa]|uniref:Leucine-rich melanocyte differentiation-associated protein n=1 Tax=Tegillarca granosa TaxID=220873 RepID=A0ABQ9F1T6_TEGGR|nr:hypothetical protein KUTeg_010719 [Tegillarca granosa]
MEAKMATSLWERQNLAYQDLSEFPPDLAEKEGAKVEELDLTCNKLTDLKFLIDYPRLTTLILDHNNIQSHVKIPLMPTLHTLWVNHNKIKNLGTFVSTLTKNCPNLKLLSMMNNEAAPSYFNGGTFQQYMDYRYFVISKLPKLEVLDDKKITPDERSEAERIYGRTVSICGQLNVKLKSVRW